MIELDKLVLTFIPKFRNGSNIHTEIQNSQNNFEKVEESWRANAT